MIKILLVSTEPFESTWAYYSLGILNALKSKNHQIIFIYMEGDANLERLIPTSITSSKVVKKKSKIGQIVQKIYPTDLKKEIKKIFNQYSIRIIHFLSPDYIITPIVSNLSKLANVIYTVHDATPHHYKLKGIKEHLFVYFMYSNIQKNMKIISNLTTNSMVQFKYLSSQFPTKNIFYFRMPSFISETIKTGKLCCSELPSKINGYILFFGSTHIYKGIDILIKAYLQSCLQSKVKLIIAGAGSHNPLENISHSNIIFIHRYIKDAEIRSLFENARCVVYPYTSITQTAVVQFPYFFKIPVIASNLDHFKDCIVDGKTGFLFKNGNIEQLSKLLEYVCSDAFNPEPMKAAMAEQFEKCYSEEGLGKELQFIYNNFEKNK